MLALALLLVMSPLMGVQEAWAQSEPTKPVCTDFAKLMADNANGSENGILTNITTLVKTEINAASQKLYSAFTDSNSYQSAVNAAMVLMVTIYGVAFTIGVVQASFGQVLIRLMKLGMIYALISPSGGWQFFNAYAVKFFNDGTDQIIGKVMEIGTGVAYTGGSPFKQLDGIANFVLSPDMIVAVMGSAFSGGPYGLAFSGLLAFSIGGLLKMLLEGLKTYALSFVVRSLLLGVAPIFIVFLLFDRTKQLFTGWLNALINLSLQPILYFTFISFFVVLLTSSAKDMLGANNELCWMEYQNAQGTTNKTSFWRFRTADGTDLGPRDWKGEISCQLNGGKTSDGKPCPEFPLNVVDILSFLLLVYIAQRFSTVTDRIASDISNAFVNLDKNMRMDIPGQQKEGGGQPKQTSEATPKGSGGVPRSPGAGTTR